MNNEEQTTYYQARIKEMLTRVPAGVSGGSYDNAVAYKACVAKAARVANQDRPKLLALQSAHNALAAFH